MKGSRQHCRNCEATRGHYMDSRRPPIRTVVQSAVVAASIAAVVSIAGRETLTRPLPWSLGSFAAAIPIALLVFVMLQAQARLARSSQWRDTGGVLRVVEVGQELAYTTCFGGFLCLFWSFDPVIGAVFGLCSAGAVGAGFATGGLGRPLGWLRR